MKFRQVLRETGRVSPPDSQRRLAVRREYGFYPPSDLRFSLSEKEKEVIDFALSIGDLEKSKKGGPERG